MVHLHFMIDDSFGAVRLAAAHPSDVDTWTRSKRSHMYEFCLNVTVWIRLMWNMWMNDFFCIALEKGDLEMLFFIKFVVVAGGSLKYFFFLAQELYYIDLEGKRQVLCKKRPRDLVEKRPPSLCCSRSLCVEILWKKTSCDGKIEI